MTSKELVRRISWMPLIGTVALCVGLWGPPERAEAKEFVFVAQELGKGGSVFEMGETEIWPRMP